MSRIKPRLDRIAGWTISLGLIGAIVIFFGGPFVGLPLFYLLSNSCSTETISRNAELPNLLFEVSQSRCGFLGRAEHMTVSVSHGSGLLSWFEKTDILDYWGQPESPVTITRVGEGTVQVAVIGTAILSQKDRWNDVAFKFDIRPRQ